MSGKGRILCATYFGRGCVREYLGSLCALYQRVMFVCARGELSRSGIGEEVSAILRGEGKHAAVFSGVSSALTYRQVHAGADAARTSEAEQKEIIAKYREVGKKKENKGIQKRAGW